MLVDSVELDKILTNVKIIAKEAGEKILEIYNSAEDSHIETKTIQNHTSPLTTADIAANTIIVNSLEKLYPTHAILTEEAKDNLARLQNEYVWIIDPLDGTKEFLKHNGDFTVNIALVYEKKPILGVVYAPAKNELYYASKRNGAYLQIENKVAQRIHVSTRSNINEMIILKSRSHAKPLFTTFIEKHSFKEIKEVGSSLKGCKIASGYADVYCRFGNTNEWDICAMQCILEEAGGVMTSIIGEEMSYNNENTLNSGFILSNGQIHKELVQWCKEIV